MEEPRGVSEHQEACGTARCLRPSRFNNTPASKLRVVLSSPGDTVVRSCDSLPCAWQGNPVFPGPGELSSEETCIHRRTLKSCCRSSCGAQCHRRCPGSMESPLKTLSVPWLPNKCQHRAHAQLQSSFESLLLAHI